jgi:hypothetical protein
VRILLAFAAALAAIAAVAGPQAEVAVACSCGRVEPARDLPGFDAAFVGIVASQRIDGSSAFWTFDVERAVKGALPSPIVVRTSSSGAACGLELGDGERTGLLVQLVGIEYESALCYQTDPGELARFVLPHARVLGRATSGAGWPWWLIAAGAGGLAAAALAPFAFRPRA